MDASVNRIRSSQDERTLLISLKLKEQKFYEIKYSLEELKLLAQTAGAIVIDSKIINREKINAAYIVGRGYLSILKEYLEEEKIKLIIFDLNNIRPAQIRNLEDFLKCRVLGRTEIILDIFAKRARSAEAKVQIELAQLKYILPRLKGLGGVLSRLGGGIGTRGPGEKMIETDRRHITKRIGVLQKKLSKFEAHRLRTRSQRSKEFWGSVVGYTNAGKSTLINVLAKDDLFVENRLFATLDSYTRIVYLAPKCQVLLTDTVGFIRNLPANLIESFKSTLEDIKNSDFIIHVIDINSFDLVSNIETVEEELKNLEGSHKSQIIFFNKVDLLKDRQKQNFLEENFPQAIIGSMKNQDGLEKLKASILNIYQNHNKKFS